MTDTDIRTALEQATGDLRTPPDLLDRVRAGGHRRVVRRRALLAAGLATIAAGSTAGVLLGDGDGDGQTPVASPLLDRPTRGDLRRDAGFRKLVHAAWREHLGGLSVRGEPHVVWAGLAPHAQRAAVVAQRVPQRVASPAGQISYGLTGFVEETAAGLRVISLEELLTGATNGTAVLLGPERDVLMVLDDGRGVRYSPEPAYTREGAVRRTFTPLDFGVHDGVAFEAPEARPGLVRMALRADVPDARGDRSISLANYSQLVSAAGRGGPHATERKVRSLAGADAALAEDGPWDVASRDAYLDRYGYRITPPADTWFIRGATADRRRFVVQTLTSTDDRSRLFLSLGTPDPVLLGYPDATAPLPVRVRLRDGQGVVVATASGTLRYRPAGGAWLPVAGDAALLPAAAVEAEVTPRAGRAVRVPLT